MKQVVNIVLLTIFLLGLGVNITYSKNANTNTALNEFKVVKNVEWAKPDGQSLTMDIYIPQTGKASYPVLIIYHGGGWLINNNSVMDSMSTYLVTHTEYIICNVNYRLLVDNDNTVKMNQIVEDALGAVVWVKDNIASYGGNPEKIVVTGDSAGGHLAAMVIYAADNLESDGFEGNTLGFNPTYLPKGKTAEDLSKEKALEVQGAILSYPALDIYASCSNGFESANNFFWTFAGKTARGIFGDKINTTSNPEYYKAVSPIYLIPKAGERKLPPQLCIVGSKDNLIIPSSIQSYVKTLTDAGFIAEYWEHQGRPHAFLDSGKNEYLGTEFRKDAPPALDRMIEFLNKI